MVCPSPCQRGVPLDDDTLSKMSEEVRAFWESFLQEALDIINQKEAAGEEEPFQPTPELEQMYFKALDEYGGEPYCQMRHLKDMFTFRRPAETCRHANWEVVRDGPPPHWKKRCVDCGTEKSMTSEEAFAD